MRLLLGGKSGILFEPIGGRNAETGLCIGDGWRMDTTQTHEKPHLLIGDMSASQGIGSSRRRSRSLTSRRYRQMSPSGVDAAAGVTPVGLRPPFVTPAAAHSHPDCRGIPILIVAPHGSLCTASVEQIFPRDRVQRNYFELALYHECISNRIGSGIRNCPRRRCRRATFGALPTLSVRDRAIIVLNDHRFWGYASGPSSSGNTLPSSIHWPAMPLAAAPYRASGLVVCRACSIARK